MSRFRCRPRLGGTLWWRARASSLSPPCHGRAEGRVGPGGRRVADERGAVLVEYAAVLALVVAGAALGVSGVNDAATNLLERQAACVAETSPLTCPPGGGSE